MQDSPTTQRVRAAYHSDLLAARKMKDAGVYDNLEEYQADRLDAKQRYQRALDERMRTKMTESEQNQRESVRSGVGGTTPASAYAPTTGPSEEAESPPTKRIRKHSSFKSATTSSLGDLAAQYDRAVRQLATVMWLPPNRNASAGSNNEVEPDGGEVRHLFWHMVPAEHTKSGKDLEIWKKRAGDACVFECAICPGKCLDSRVSCIQLGRLICLVSG